MKNVVLFIVLGLFAVGCQDFYIPMGVGEIIPVNYYYLCEDEDNDTIYYNSVECTDECDSCYVCEDTDEDGQCDG